MDASVAVAAAAFRLKRNKSPLLIGLRFLKWIFSPFYTVTFLVKLWISLFYGNGLLSSFCVTFEELLAQNIHKTELLLRTLTSNKMLYKGHVILKY